MIDRSPEFAHFGPHLEIFGNLLCAKCEQDAEHDDDHFAREDAPWKADISKLARGTLGMLCEE
jgi:hypothetical protein